MKRIAAVLLLILAISALACAPRQPVSPPQATPQAPAPAPAPAAPAPAAPRPSPEEEEWQKVVREARKEGQATIYTWGYIGDTGVQIRNSFRARYGVDLDIVTGRGAEFTERLKTEQRIGQMTADLTQGAGVHLLNMKNQGLLEAASGLPSLRSKENLLIDPFLDKEGYVVNESLQIIGPMVNTKLVRPEEEPRSWQDMLNPKWKGKLLAHSPMVSTGMYVAFVPLLNAKAVTVEWLRAIGGQDPILTRGDQETADKLSRGEAPMALILADSMAASYAKEGAPLKAIPMAEGVTVSPLVIAQIKKAPHPNAAKLFLDWIVSKEGQSVYHKSKGSASLRKDVPDFRPQSVSLPAGTKLVLENEAYASEGTKKYVDKWLVDLWKK